MENGNRTQSVDIAKGILIILVVVAHAQADIVHDIIFIFHKEHCSNRGGGYR